MKTITKKEVSKHVAKSLNEKYCTAEKVVNGVFKSLKDIIIESDGEVRIEIRGFGVLEVKNTKPNPKARNPMTGEIVHVPARKKVHFRAGKLLKESLKKPLKEE